MVMPDTPCHASIYVSSPPQVPFPLATFQNRTRFPGEHQAGPALEPARDAHPLYPSVPGTTVHASLLQGQGTRWGGQEKAGV